MDVTPTVVRVLSETGGGTGIPVGPNRVITAAHIIEGVAAASVDGLPMVVSEESKFRLSTPRAYVDDWVLLEGTVERFKPDRIDGELEVSPGDKVVIVGYAPPPGGDLSEFNKAAPREVDGKVMPRYDHNELSPDLIYIELPENAHSYRGLSGGAVAKRMPNGELVVFGMAITATTGREVTVEERAIRREFSAVGVRRIPKF